MFDNYLQKKAMCTVITLLWFTLLTVFFVGCTTVETPPEALPIEPETVVEQPIEEEPTVPYPISFATNLQEALATSSIEDALLLFDDIPEEFAGDADLNYLHASLLVSSGDFNKADTLTQELLAGDPESTDIQFLQAMVLKGQGKTRESKSVIEDILEKDPTNVDANVEMANTYMAVKNFRLANKHFVEGLKAEPEDPSSLFGHALTSWYLENDDAAKDALNKLVEVEPENSLGWAYLAKLSADRGKFADAVTYLQTAIQYDENYYYHWLDLGSYYRNLNQKEDAEAAWSRAIELDSEYFLGYAYRGGLRDEMSKYDGALSDYINVVKYNPAYYYAYESIGMLYWKNEQWTEARNAFLRAYESSPQSVSYALLISATYQKENNRVENQEFLSKAMRGVDRSSLDYQVLRLYYDGLGDAAVLNKVVNEDSNTTRGKMLFYMALFYELIGHQDLANKYYIEVYDMQAPMFFEYRFCEWAVEDMKKNNITY